MDYLVMLLNYRCYNINIKTKREKEHNTSLISDPCERLDIVFILDMSESVNRLDPNNWANMQTFVKNFAAQYDTWGAAGVQMGVNLHNITLKCMRSWSCHPILV